MIEQVSIKSYNGVTSSTRTSVENSVNDFKSQIKCNKEFLEGLTIHTVIDSKYLDGNSVLTKYAKESHEYKKTTFTTSPAYNEGKKEIVLNVGTPLSGILDINKSNSDTQQLLFHEIGHCFDEYFGSSDEELLEKVKEISFSFEPLNKNEEDIKSMQKQYVELNKNLKQEKDKIETIEKLESKLNKISEKEKEKEKEQDQEQIKKKKRNILL